MKFIQMIQSLLVQSVSMNRVRFQLILPQQPTTSGRLLTGPALRSVNPHHAFNALSPQLLDRLHRAACDSRNSNLADDQLPALRPTPDFSSSKTCLEEFMQHVSDHKSWPLRPPPQNMMRCEHNN